MRSFFLKIAFQKNSSLFRRFHRENPGWAYDSNRPVYQSEGTGRIFQPVGPDRFTIFQLVPPVAPLTWSRGVIAEGEGEGLD